MAIVLKEHDEMLVTPVALPTYHYGVSFLERMSTVEAKVEGITLTDLYPEKACVADVQ